MRILVDGYNFAHASGILSRNIGPGTLQRARDGVLGFLTSSLVDTERAATTVVFDAKNAPPDQPRDQLRDGIRVVYAFGYATADLLIQQLIRENSAPRQLVVVTGDQQIQRAARRRRATIVDSEEWHADLLSRRQTQRSAKSDPIEKPDDTMSDSEVESWLEFFGEDVK